MRWYPSREQEGVTDEKGVVVIYIYTKMVIDSTNIYKIFQQLKYLQQ